MTFSLIKRGMYRDTANEGGGGGTTGGATGAVRVPLSQPAMPLPVNEARAPNSEVFNNCRRLVSTHANVALRAWARSYTGRRPGARSYKR